MAFSRQIRFLICLLATFPLAVSSSAVNAEDKEAGEAAERLFVRRVWPLLNEKCLACHGDDVETREGGLDLSQRAGLLQGGDSGEPALIPNQAEESSLYLAATWKHDLWSPMPPKEAEKLTPEQLGWVKDWINGGAPWPDATEREEIAAANEGKWSAEDGIPMQTSGGLSDDWTNRKYRPEDLWAYQPVQQVDVSLRGPEQNPIDWLVERELPAGLPTADRADRLTLIRRASFDLTGLPPSPAEIEQFVNDPRSDQAAFGAVVERLLASPHYGERMAQHWLDVVRYADSSGFANDYERGNAWRYRDYVTRAFNEDKPYDQFVREQLAGDELDADDPELLVATGFLRMGPWELTGMEVPKVARQRFLDDVTNSVGETFLAHALQCARCHDHKFDPVPTRDYYGIQAVFATTQLAERTAEFLPEENRTGFDEKRYLDVRRAEYKQILQKLDDILLDNAAAWFAENGISPQQWNEILADMRARGKTTGLFGAVRNEMRKRDIPESQFPSRHVGFTPDQFGLERVARKGLSRLDWEFDRYRPFALAVYSGRTPNLKAVYSPLRMPQNAMKKGELEETCILTGGDPFANGTPVDPSVLSVVDGGNSPDIPDTISGRRKAFAEWITSSENPLTPRVMVNRLWLWHFGQPIAGNPNNFGATGKKPTHPELLDWLASELKESGWSVKAMHRLIMNSEAYCRSSAHPIPSAVGELDPLGVSYAVFQPRRLTAEEMRDAMLAITGELNTSLGGIPCRPEINAEAALQPRQVMGAFASAWIPNPKPEDRHRRSLYVLRLRGLPVPAFDVFNAPSPDFSCEFRQASTVTPQVFTLFNGLSSHRRALVLANRVLQETDSDAAAISRCFELTYGRLPSEEERQLCLAHWRDMERHLPDEAVDFPLPPTEVTRDAVEENTGQPFSFAETLHSNAEFIPDLQPSETDRHTRALADVCLALFNSNEFVYVY